MSLRPGTSAKLRLVIQHGLGTLRAGEKHGLQPALLIHWANHLTDVVCPDEQHPHHTSLLTSITDSSSNKTVFIAFTCFGTK